jgi:hypothetical protein
MGVCNHSSKIFFTKNGPFHGIAREFLVGIAGFHEISWDLEGGS